MDREAGGYATRSLVLRLRRGGGAALDSNVAPPHHEGAGPGGVARGASHETGAAAAVEAAPLPTPAGLHGGGGGGGEGCRRPTSACRAGTQWAAPVSQTPDSART